MNLFTKKKTMFDSRVSLAYPTHSALHAVYTYALRDHRFGRLI